jgi:hypothetical protein
MHGKCLQNARKNLGQKKLAGRNTLAYFALASMSKIILQH